ncbi:F-box only protein 28-like [Octopus vulgaris]|uniref:F-box only protein 28-like n=2 Tax=Octopus TaxID=6643 RepID=A0AA36B9U6_OCTVU|nr:F-box only protein 28 [Octopus sinensis]CAI9730470.1 F-box only protein 28-like [Octopus vulgaris]
MAADDDGKQSLNIRNLPKEVFNKILTYLQFQEVSEIRLVCHSFNVEAQAILNQGFTRVHKYHAFVQRQIKGQLPRRESERRNHQLARHVDILSAIETRLSLLGMTYLRYIDMGLCCFIPGKVLDELYHILQTLQCTCQPPRAHEFLQELRDISSMAMEHFEEKIVPSLKQKMPSVRLTLGNFNVNSESEAGTSSAIVPLNNTQPSIRAISLREEITNMHTLIRSHSNSMKVFKRELNEMQSKYSMQRKNSRELAKKVLVQKKRCKIQNKCLSDLNTRLLEEERKVDELSSKLLSQGKTMAELNDRVNDQGRKIAELNQKLVLYEDKFTSKLPSYADLDTKICEGHEEADFDSPGCNSVSSVSEHIVDPSLDHLSDIANQKARKTIKRRLSVSENQSDLPITKHYKQ